MWPWNPGIHSRMQHCAIWLITADPKKLKCISVSEQVIITKTSCGRRQNSGLKMKAVCSSEAFVSIQNFTGRLLHRTTTWTPSSPWEPQTSSAEFNFRNVITTPERRYLRSACHPLHCTRVSRCRTIPATDNRQLRCCVQEPSYQDCPAWIQDKFTWASWGILWRYKAGRGGTVCCRGMRTYIQTEK